MASPSPRRPRPKKYPQLSPMGGSLKKHPRPTGLPRGELVVCLEACMRARGYIHVQGPHKGKLNYYRLMMETGIPIQSLKKLVTEGYARNVGSYRLAILKEVLNVPVDMLIQWQPREPDLDQELKHYENPHQRKTTDDNEDFLVSW